MRLVLLILAACLPHLAMAGTVSASRTLPAGTIIGASDLYVAPEDDPAAADAMIGLQTRITVYAGRAVNPAHLQPPRLVSRNQVVALTFATGALRIETEGRALAEGAAGDIVPVMNLSSRRTVNAMVQPNGTLRIIR